MSYASETMNAFNYLFEKYDKVLKQEYARVPSASLIRVDKDKPYRQPMNDAEHDKLYEYVQTCGLTNLAMSRETGWSPAVISDIRKKQHPRYDPIRSEKWRNK